MSNVLIIGDCHAPCMHKKYIPFLKKIYKKYNCNKVVHIGDVINYNAISYHPSRLDLRDPEIEFRKAHKQVQQLYEAFPKLDWLIGNHDALPRRKALDACLPDLLFKDEVDLWDVPGWRVHSRYTDIKIDGVIYRHGDKGKGGRFPAIMNAEQNFTSLVMGHWHSVAGVELFANEERCIFGMQTGCGIDHHRAEMEYGMKFNKKPILSCGVVINGEDAYVERMHLKNKI